MHDEVDSIIGYHRASGAPGRVTDINTPGVHSDGSAHYMKGTCSDSGCQGCAVDFAFVPSQRMSPGLLAIWTAFSKVESQLWELFYEGAPYWIKDGQQKQRSLFSTALRDAHRNHVHVAIRPGKTLLIPNQLIPASSPEQAMTLVIDPVGTVPHPIDQTSGWAFGRRGHVYHINNARHCGGWDQATRSDPKRWCVALVPTTSGDGYWLVSNLGEVYAYGDAVNPGNYQSKWGAGEIIGAWRNSRQPGGGITLLRDDGKNLNRYALPA